MANVFFKRGLHAGLPTSGTSSVVDGAFYLTTDTHRLYVGQGQDLVELNKSITSVANVSNLPTGTGVAVGQFYYVENSNILCYYSRDQKHYLPNKYIYSLSMKNNCYLSNRNIYN